MADPGPSQPDRYRIATRRLVIDSDDYPSVKQIQHTLETSSDPIVDLDLSHCELADLRTTELLHFLNPSQQHVTSELDELEQRIKMAQAVAKMLKTPPSNPYSTIRTLLLANNDLISKSLFPISQFIRHNVCLKSLELKGNKIGSDTTDTTALIELAQSIGQSTLQYLGIGSNPLGVDTFVAFMDALPDTGTPLIKLELSCALADLTEDIFLTPTQGLEAARAVARFIADEARCRDLKRLELNGNSFGYKGVRAIVAAQIGTAYGPYKLPEKVRTALSKAQRNSLCETLLPTSQTRPNRSIVEIGLAGNVDEGWVLPEENEAERQAATGSFLERAAPASWASISRYFLSRARKAKGSLTVTDEEQVESSSSNRAYDAVHAMTQEPVMSHRDDLQELERLIAEAGGDADAWHREVQEALEVGSGVDRLNWRTLFNARITLNRVEGRKVRRTALDVLSIARTVGCCVRRGPTEDQAELGFSKFMDLPPELRLHVLRQVDEEALLSERQLSEIVSWAQERSTIGYGEEGYDWQVPGSITSWPEESRGLPAVLPCHAWSWADCFLHRSPPRDWTAAIFDDHAGYGGLFPRNIKPSFTPHRPVHYSQEPLAKRPRQPRPVSGGTLAFWECTGTNRPDSSLPFVGDPQPLESEGVQSGFSTGAKFVKQ